MRRLGGNAGMARDDSRARLRRVALTPSLDGARPSGASGWVSPVARLLPRPPSGPPVRRRGPAYRLHGSIDTWPGLILRRICG